MTRRFVLGTVLVSVASLLSRLLGVYRDHLYAVIFGASSGSGLFSLDTYYAAFRIPDFLYSVLLYGAISAAFLPLFTAHKARGDHDAAWRFASAVLSLLVCVIVVFAAIFALFADFFVPFLTPGFTGETLTVTVLLTRVMLLSTIFFGVSSLFQSIGNAFHRYLSYAIAPILYNLSLILSAFFFAPTYGVYALAWGVVIGAFLHMVIQLPTMYACGFRFRLDLGWDRADVRQLFLLTIPRVFGIVTGHFNLLVETVIASTLVAGSLTVLNYAVNMQSLPVGMVGLAVAVVSFVTFAEFAATRAYKDFLQTLFAHLQQIFFFVIPAAVGLYLLRHAVIKLILVGGAFTEADAVLTAHVLAVLLPGVLAQSTVPLLSRAFYALNNTVLPVLASVLSLGVNIFVSLVAVYYFDFGVVGLAMSNTIAAFIQFFALLWFLEWYFVRHAGLSLAPHVPWGRFGMTLLSSGVMAAVVLFLLFITAWVAVPVSWMHLFVVTVVIAGSGAGVYFGMQKVLQMAFKSAKV